MAQHSYTIADAMGGTIRADLNNALLAVVTNNSGLTPSTVYPGMTWLDPTNGVVWRRNASNTSWNYQGPYNDTPVQAVTASSLTVVVKHHACALICNSATIQLLPGNVVGAGWNVSIKSAAGTSTIRTTPGNYVDGGSLCALSSGQGVKVWSDGTNHHSFGR